MNFSRLPAKPYTVPLNPKRCILNPEPSFLQPISQPLTLNPRTLNPETLNSSFHFLSHYPSISPKHAGWHPLPSRVPELPWELSVGLGFELCAVYLGVRVSGFAVSEEVTD